MYGSNSVYNTVFLDSNAWDLLKDQKDVMQTYLRGRYSVDDFGTSSSIALGNYEIRFTTAYKEPAIEIVQLNALKRPEDPKHLHDAQDPYSDQEVKILEKVQGASAKNRRITPESSPMFVMQLTFCDGLFQLGECIDLLIRK